MSSNRETPILIASLVITVGLVGGGYWWLSRDGGFSLGGLLGGGGDTPTGSVTAAGSSAPAPTGEETLAQVGTVPTGTFNYGGSTTWAPIRGEVDSVLRQVHPGFQLRYTDPINAPPGSGTGIAMLLSNQIAFSQSSRPLNAEERQRAQQQGYPLKEIPVAIEGIAIAVHPELAVEGITVEQLRDIYLGVLTNWSQVGGPNLAIVPFSRPDAGGTVEFFGDTVLGGASLGSIVRTAGTTTEALRLVSSTPGSIYYASAPEVVGQCTVKPIALGRTPDALVPPYREPYVPPSACPGQRNQLNAEGFFSGDYPITRRMFVIVREDGSSDQQAGEAYAALLLTRQGQTLLQEAGFIPIR